MDASWTDERVTLLKRLYADGLSASQMAAQLGYVTRNAVVGKLHRLGVAKPLRGKPVPREKKEYKPREVIGVRPAMSGRPDLPILALPDPDPGVIENIIPIGQRCGLLDLTAHKCRWPLGTPGMIDFYFCGGAPLEGTPYCGYHCRVAYQPPTARRSREYSPRV